MSGDPRVEWFPSRASRRDFLIGTGRLSLTGGLALVGGGSLAAFIAACNSSPASTHTTTVDTITCALASLDNQSADPHQAFGHANETAPIAWSIAEPLVRRDLNADLVPCLATSWDVSADGLTWTFTLRAGVTMQDGSKFTARDIKTAVDRSKLPTTLNDPNYSDQLAVVSAISNVNVIDDSHVAITTNKPYATLNVDIPVPIPTDYYAKVGEAQYRLQPLQAGAFMYVSRQLNQSMTLRRFDGFWDASRRPNYKNLVFQIVPEESSRLAGLLSGSIDVAWALSKSSAQQVQNAHGYRVLSIPSASTSECEWMDTRLTNGHVQNPNSPLVNVKVRQALFYALDRVAISKAIFQGDASPATNFTEGAAYNDPNLKPYPYDPAKAKQLLQEAGYPNPSFRLSAPTSNAYVGNIQDLGSAMQSYWQAVGAIVDYRPTDTALLSAMKDAHTVTGAMLGVIPGSKLFDPAFVPNGQMLSKSSDSAVYDPQLDALIDNVNTAIAPNQRLAAAVTLNEYIYNNLSIGAVLEHSALAGVGPHIGDWPLMKGQGGCGPFWYLQAK